MVEPSPFAALTGYELRNLAAHLVSCDRADHLHRLLAMESAATDHANAWFDIRERNGDLRGYLDDVERARTAAQRASADPNQVETAVPLEIHYVLIEATLSALAETTPDALRAELLRAGVWTADQALADARRLRVAGERAEALVVLLDALEDDVTREAAVTETLALTREEQLYWLTPRLGAQLDTADRETLEREAEQWVARDARPQPVEPLPWPDRTPEARVRQVDSAIRAIVEYPDVSGAVVRRLDSVVAASEPASDEVIAGVLDASRALPAIPRRNVLNDLAPTLPSELLARAGKLGRRLDDALVMLGACADLAPLLSPDVRLALRGRVEELPESYGRASELGRLAATLAAEPTERSTALDTLLAIEPGSDDSWLDERRALALALLADFLDGDGREMAWSAAVVTARRIEADDARAEAFAAIASTRNGEPYRSRLLDEAYRAAGEESPNARQALILVKLARGIADDERASLLARAAELLATPDLVEEEDWFRGFADGLISFVNTQLAAARLAGDGGSEHRALVEEVLRSVESLGRVGVFLSAYVERPAALASAADLIRALPPDQRARALRSAFGSLARRARDEAVPGLAALMPAIVAVAGAGAADAFVNSCLRLLAWWP